MMMRFLQQLLLLPSTAVILLLLQTTTTIIPSVDGQGLLSFSTLGGDVAGLCSPRKITIWRNTLYVAESGVGLDQVPANVSLDTENCVEGGFNGIVCMGPTARVSSYYLGDDGDSTRQTVVDGLFSWRPVAGDSEPHATGAQSICFDDAVDDGTWFLVIGLGLNGTELTMMDVDTEIGAFGSVLRFGPNETDDASFAVLVAAPWEDEYANNYDGSTDPTGVLPVPDSNPYHVSCVGDYYYVADAGCNCVMKYDDLGILDGEVAEPASVLVIPNYEGLPAIPCDGVTPPMGPPFCGQYQLDVNGTATWFYDVEPVPTSVKTRPGVTDKLYISTLVGALWNYPSAQVLEVSVDENGDFINGTIVEVAGDFYAVGDFAFYGTDILLVLELSPGVPTIPFSGRLTQVDLQSGEKTVLAEAELTYPSGIVVDGDMVYITNNTYAGGVEISQQCQGHVIMADLRQAGGADGTPTISPMETPTEPPTTESPTVSPVEPTPTPTTSIVESPSSEPPTTSDAYIVDPWTIFWGLSFGLIAVVS